MPRPSSTASSGKRGGIKSPGPRRILHLDVFSGIAGNMFAAALIDLGLKRKQLEEDLAGLGVVAVGADTWALEALPSEDPQMAFPVHPELLALNGVYILENMDTRALAADGATEFLFVLGQPRFVGAVQAVINPVAIR